MRLSYPSFESSDWSPFILYSSIQHFQQALTDLSSYEFSSIFHLLQNNSFEKGNFTDPEAKLILLIDHLSKLNQFDLFAHALSTDSFLAFTSFLLTHPLYLKVLAPVLMHLPSSLFLQSLPHFHSLLSLEESELFLEPVCYQLTLSIHNFEKNLKEVEQKTENLKQKISSLDPSTLSTLYLEIKSLSEEVKKKRDLLDLVLEKAWQTERQDLVNKLGILKEHFTYLLYEQIGSPLTFESSAKGLYILIEKVLASVFDLSLKNEDAALEGLACLKIWKIKDYWEVGLLPSLSSPLETSKENVKELMQQVEKNLSCLNLHQVKDLKREGLFSDQLLKLYIQKHQKQLINFVDR